MDACRNLYLASRSIHWCCDRLFSARSRWRLPRPWRALRKHRQRDGGNYVGITDGWRCSWFYSASAFFFGRPRRFGFTTSSTTSAAFSRIVFSGFGSGAASGANFGTTGEEVLGAGASGISRVVVKPPGRLMVIFAMQLTCSNRCFQHRWVGKIS